MEINARMILSEHLTSPSEAVLGHSSELDATRLSPHFTLGEFMRSQYSEVYNVPTYAAIENLKRLCEWLEHLREMYNVLYSDGTHPIVINSGYRSPQLNRKVGGAPGSNHLTGCAADIRVYGIEQALRYAVILLNYADNTDQDFDELLIERSPKGTYWLHFAVRPSENRRKVLFINTN